MEKIEKKVTIYKSKDGIEFENSNECRQHEKQMKFRNYYAKLNSKDEFEVTENHLKLLKKCYVDFSFFNNNYEDGTFHQNSSNHYGNDDWRNDIAEILNIEPEESDSTEKWYSEEQYFEIWKYHFELNFCIQILCRTLSIKKGIYKKEKYTQNWAFSHCL